MLLPYYSVWKGPANTVTINKPPGKRAAFHNFQAAASSLLLILPIASRGEVFPPVYSEETGPERGSDLSKGTCLLNVTHGLKLARATWMRGVAGGACRGENRDTLA